VESVGVVATKRISCKPDCKYIEIVIISLFKISYLIYLHILHMFLFGFILCVTFVTRWSCFITVSVELSELMNLLYYSNYLKVKVITNRSEL